MATIQRNAHEDRLNRTRGARTRSAILDAWLRTNLTLLDMRFERQHIVNWTDVCGTELLPSWKKALFGSHRAPVPKEYELQRGDLELHNALTTQSPK